MELPAFSEVQAAVAEQRAVIEVDRLTARWLVVQGRTPIAAYIGSGSRWFFRGLGGVYAGGLVAGVALLVGGWFVYAALVFLAAIVVQQVWGGLAVELLRAIALKESEALHLALRDGWITVIAPPVGPGRTPRPASLGTGVDPSYAEEIAQAKATLAHRPDDAQLRFDLGITYLLASRFDDAIEESRLLTMLDARLAAKLQALARLLSS